MNNDISKSKDYIFKDNKDMIKNSIDSGCGYNFDDTKPKIIENDYSKVYHFINKDFIRNNKIR